MIVVLETIKAVPGKMDLLKQALLELVPISRQAKGCLQYDLLEPKDQVDELLVLMRWETHAHLEQHESSDYIEEFVRKYDQILYGQVLVTEWKKIPI